MRSTHPEFSEATLDELLRALRARTSGHSDNPGLVASFPGVRESRMDAACGELASRGYPVFRIAIPGRTHDGWAIRSMTGLDVEPLLGAAGVIEHQSLPRRPD